MPQVPRFPNIPSTDGTSESFQKAIIAITQTLAMLTGTDPKSQTGAKADRNMVHTFVQDTPPEALNLGDFWLCKNSKITLSCWDGSRWVHLLDAP